MSEGALERFITRVLRVPPQPDPPIGSPGSVRVFNAARGFYRYRLAQWGFSQAGTVVGLVVGLVVLARVEGGPVTWVRGFVGPLEVLAVFLFLVQLPITFLMVRLDYRYRWYMVTDSSLRIREGLLSVHERTMTFANIQNLSLRQGPLQRLFGISDLRVRTAGGGGGEGAGHGDAESSLAANMHLGYFRGVDNAAEIRDLVMDRMRGLRDSGLGDPDEPAAVLPVANEGADDAADELLDAARALRDEARRLRGAVEAR